MGIFKKKEQPTEADTNVIDDLKNTSKRDILQEAMQDSKDKITLTQEDLLILNNHRYNRSYELEKLKVLVEIRDLLKQILEKA